MSNLFNPKKYGFKNPLTNSAFDRKFNKEKVLVKNTNPCEREKLIEGGRAIKEGKSNG